LSSQAEVRGSNNGTALFGKEGRDLLQQRFGFFAEKAIGGGYHERCKVSELLEASLKILLTFPFVR
jgi:hypothetical protein